MNTAGYPNVQDEYLALNPDATFKFLPPSTMTHLYIARCLFSITVGVSYILSHILDSFIDRQLASDRLGYGTPLRVSRMRFFSSEGVSFKYLTRYIYYLGVLFFAR